MGFVHPSDMILKSMLAWVSKQRREYAKPNHGRLSREDTRGMESFFGWTWPGPLCFDCIPQDKWTGKFTEYYQDENGGGEPIYCMYKKSTSRYFCMNICPRANYCQ